MGTSLAAYVRGFRRGGRYFIGKDIQEVRHALSGWGTTAENLWRHMPALPMSLPAAAE
jgi:hypothetical protein